MSKLLSLKVREVIRKLKKAGYVEWRHRGGYLALYRECDGLTVTIPTHFSKDVPKGTLRAIIKEANLSVEQFNDL